MTDPRVIKLADLIVNYSCAVKPGENVLIEATDIAEAFTVALIRSIAKSGGRPVVMLKSNAIQRALMNSGTEDHWNVVADVEKFQMEKMHCYIGARGSHNIAETSDVPADKTKIYERTVWQRVHQDVRIRKTRWVVFRWPTPSFAQLAEMSSEAFEDFFFNVCTLDYAKMGRAMQPLIELMNRTDKVHLKGPGETDLRFSIKGIPAIGCDGKLNIPDGEVFTAPVRDSVEGIIQFNCPTVYRGVTHNNIKLTFQKGKVVHASSNFTEKLNEVLDSDEGARYIGEFAIGFNPYCTKPMKDILFDEKIAGSIHFTPGRAYEEADNGNRSQIHWDMVLLQTPEAGGGEIWFDGKLIRKDGRFVLRELEPLNPENLK